MKIKNGVDLVEIKRIEALITRKEHFVRRFFTEKECALFEEKNGRAETIAANFAGKEAIAKAFGTGVRGFDLNELEILRDSLGKPYVTLYGRARKRAEEDGLKAIEISLSHTAEHAIAFVIAIY